MVVTEVRALPLSWVKEQQLGFATITARIYPTARSEGGCVKGRIKANKKIPS